MKTGRLKSTVRLCFMAGVAMLFAGLPVFAEETSQAGIIQRLSIDEALSKKMPQAVKDLPVFGKIDWKVQKLPFIGDGPEGGICGMAMAAVDGQIVLAGGYIPGGDDSDATSRNTSKWAFRFNPATGEWSALPDMPRRREFAGATVVDHQLFIMGGLERLDPALGFADVFGIDLSRPQAEWRKFLSFAIARSHMSAAIAGHYLVVAGGNRYDPAEQGFSKSTVQGLNEVFDLANPAAGWQFKAFIPGEPRGWAAGISLHDRMLLFGGLTFTKKRGEDGAPGAVKLSECLSYDPTMDAWQRLPNAPLAISGWRAATYQNRYVILVGGVSEQWNDLPFVYDADTGKWMRIENPLPPGAMFNDPGVCIIGDTIYVAGAEGPADSHFNYFLAGRILPAK